MKIRNMAMCALFAALLCVCAWLCVPVGDTPVTLQTLGIALCLWLLGGKRGTLAIFVYLLLGTVGLPVFSGFQGGIGTLLGATGGYLLGFLVWGILFWLLEACLPLSNKGQILAMALSLMACYIFGTVWFCRVYLGGGNTASLWIVIAKCVLPYVLPDGLKLTAAWFLSRRLKRFVY